MSDVTQLAAELAQAKRVWLFLDYDGTLADFARTPDEVYPDPEVRDLVERLAELPHIRVTLISGRRLAHVEKLVPVPGITLAGTYGIEMRPSSGGYRYRVARDEVRPALDAVKARWAERLAGREGFYLEDKGWALALHAKYVNDAEAEAVLPAARQEAAQLIDGDIFRILGGHKFLEIGPRLAHKGRTIEHLLETDPLPGARLLYIGDDDKDEEAFAVLQAHGGQAIVVAETPRESLADYRLESPQAVRQWLKTLIELAGGNSASA